jgi:hypothetical protein
MGFTGCWCGAGPQARLGTGGASEPARHVGRLWSDGLIQDHEDDTHEAASFTAALTTRGNSSCWRVSGRTSSRIYLEPR